MNPKTQLLIKSGTMIAVAIAAIALAASAIMLPFVLWKLL